MVYLEEGYKILIFLTSKVKYRERLCVFIMQMNLLYEFVFGKALHSKIVCFSYFELLDRKKSFTFVKCKCRVQDDLLQ